METLNINENNGLVILHLSNLTCRQVTVPVLADGLTLVLSQLTLKQNDQQTGHNSSQKRHKSHKLFCCRLVTIYFILKQTDQQTGSCSCTPKGGSVRHCGDPGRCSPDWP